MRTPLSEADEAAIRHVPVGYKFDLLLIAYVKRALLTCKLKPGERIQMLEQLNALTDLYIKPEMLAAIEPMSPTEASMFEEALTLDSDSERAAASYDVLTRHEIFSRFVNLNSSLLSAIKMHETHRHASAN